MATPKNYFNGFARAVRKRFGKDGGILLGLAADIADGTLEASPREKLDAIKWLAKTGYGERPKEVDVKGAVDMNLRLPPMDLTRLSAEELAQIDGSLTKALMPASETVVEAVVAQVVEDAVIEDENSVPEVVPVEEADVE